MQEEELRRFDFSWNEENGNELDPIFGQPHPTHPGPAGSNQQTGEWVSYSTFLQYIKGNTFKSTDDAAALNALPSSDPDTAIFIIPTGKYWMTNAELKALGQTPTVPQYPDGNPMPDGWIGINKQLPVDIPMWTGIFEHEITEVMGRIGYAGSTDGNSKDQYGPMGLFRYDSQGHLNINGPGYFSLDGTTIGTRYNPDSNNDHTHGDAADWNDTNINDHDHVAGNVFGAATFKGCVWRCDLQPPVYFREYKDNGCARIQYGAKRHTQ